MNRIYLFALLAISGLAFPGPIAAQIQFTSRPDLLYDRDLHSAVPVGIADMNGDGLDDIVALDDGRRLTIQYQTPDPKRPFIRYTEKRTLDNGEQNDIVIGDFNNDGLRDIVMVGSYDRVKVLYANPFSFGYTLTYINVTPFFSQGASAGDFNHDGWLDVVLLNDNGLNYTLMNDGTGQLVVEDYIDFVTVPPSDNSGNYGSVYTDFDMDGDVDFYIAKCRQGVNNPADPRRINALFVNDGTGQYTESAALYGLANGRQSWTADFGDFDNDGDLDCFLTQHDVISELFENIDNDTFINITQQAGLDIGGVPLQGMFVDLDNDGLLDLLVSGDRVDCYRNNGDKTFTRSEPFHNTIFGTFGLGDLNHDGFVDVYASTVIPFNNPNPLRDDLLFLNAGNVHHFLALQLTDTAGNRSAIGAMALLYGPWGTQVREVRGGEQYGVSNSHQLIFGLGMETTYDSLVIRWPDGVRERFDDLDTDQHWQLTRGGCARTTVDTWSPLAVICGSDSVTFTMPLVPDGLTWSTGETADSITVTEPGLYFALYEDPNGCIVRTSPVEVIKDPDTIAPRVLYAGRQTLCQGDIATLELTESLGYLWSNGETTQSIEVNTTGSYSAIAQGYCIELTSDTLELTFIDPALPVIEPDTVLVGETAVLTAIGDSILWYADGSGIFQIGSGDTLSLPDMTETRPVWARNIVTLAGQSGQVGQLAHAGSSKYNGAVTNAGLRFEVYKEMVLEEVSVFTDSAGLRIIEIRDDSGQFGWDFPVDLAPGETRIRMDAVIPPGNYTISTNTDQNLIEFGVNSPILWRSSAGVVYPYEFSDVMAITNSTLDAINFYYYFYAWQVSEADRYCYSDLAETRVVVDTITSVSPVHPWLQLQVWPNPTTDRVRLRNMPEDVSRIEIMNAQGQILQVDRLVNDHSADVDLSPYAPGIYIIRVYGRAGAVGVKVIRL